MTAAAQQVGHYHPLRTHFHTRFEQFARFAGEPFTVIGVVAWDEHERQWSDDARDYPEALFYIRFASGAVIVAWEQEVFDMEAIPTAAPDAVSD